MTKRNWQFKVFNIMYSHIKILFDFLEKTAKYVNQVYSTTDILMKICEEQNRTLEEIREIIDANEEELDSIELYNSLTLAVDSKSMIESKKGYMESIKKGYASLSGIPDISQFGKNNLPVYATFMLNMQNALKSFAEYLNAENLVDKESYAKDIFLALDKADEMGDEAEMIIRENMSQIPPV